MQRKAETFFVINLALNANTQFGGICEAQTEVLPDITSGVLSKNKTFWESCPNSAVPS